MVELRNKNINERTMLCKKCEKFALVEDGRLHCSDCGNDLVEWH